jgi:hypothetical protein
MKSNQIPLKSLHFQKMEFNNWGSSTSPFHSTIEQKLIIPEI